MIIMISVMVAIIAVAVPTVSITILIILDVILMGLVAGQQGDWAAHSA